MVDQRSKSKVKRTSGQRADDFGDALAEEMERRRLDEEGLLKTTRRIQFANDAIAMEDTRDLLRRNREVLYPKPDEDLIGGYMSGGEPLDEMHIGDTIHNHFAHDESSGKTQATGQHGNGRRQPYIMPGWLIMLLGTLLGVLAGLLVAWAVSEMLRPAGDAVNTPIFTIEPIETPEP